MTVKKQELYNIIDALPDELLTKVIDYIEYLKFTEVTANEIHNTNNSFGLEDTTYMIYCNGQETTHVECVSVLELKESTEI